MNSQFERNHANGLAIVRDDIPVDYNPVRDVPDSDLLFSLPSELISEIFSLLTPKDLLNLTLLSKQSRRFLRPSSQTGKRTWKLMRIKLLYPNPALINKTDYEFFKIMFSSGCFYCKSRPLTRKVFWEFGGKRVCQSCQQVHFLKGYRSKYPFLMSTFVSWRQVYYLKSDIPTLELSEDQVEVLTRKNLKTFQFMEEMQKVEADRVLERRRIDDQRRESRVEEIVEFLNNRVVDLDMER